MVPMTNLTIYGEIVMTIMILNLVQFAALLRKLKVTCPQSMVMILLNILMLHTYKQSPILFYVLSSCLARLVASKPLEFIANCLSLYIIITYKKLNNQ